MNNFYIMDGYNIRENPNHHIDIDFTDEGQDEVYSHAKTILENENLNTVVDVGCGSGYKLIKYFNKNNTVGIETEPCISFLKEKYPNNVWINSGEPEKSFPDYKQNCDILICADVIEHIVNPQNLVDYLNSFDFKYLIISTPDRLILRDKIPGFGFDAWIGPPKNPAHVREWEFNEFNNFLNQNFDVIEGRHSIKQQECMFFVCKKKNEIPSTHELELDFLKDCKVVQNWTSELENYDESSNCDGIHIRNLIEHSDNWDKILRNSLKSVKKKIAITLSSSLGDKISQFMSIIKEFSPKNVYIKYLNSHTKEIILITLNQKQKVTIVSADFGTGSNFDFDIPNQIDCNYKYEKLCFNDTNTSSRKLSLHPRTKAKIPKMLQWMETDSDFYIWIDSKFKIKSQTFVNDIINLLGDSELILCKHPSRTSIKSECDFLINNMENNDQYLIERYTGESFKEQVDEYLKDKTFVDDKLFACGFFAYSKKLVKNKDYNLMTDWFFHNCYWSIQDQLSLPYLLNKHKTDYKIFDFDIFSNKYVDYCSKDLVD